MKLINFLAKLAEVMNANYDYLTQLDGVMGDSDLGITMKNGFKAAYEADIASDEEDIGKRLFAAGKAMGNAVPSTMGTLMARGFMEAGKRLRGEKDNLDLVKLTKLAEGYYDGVQLLGKARPGEKTFLDGFLPGVESLQNQSNESSLEEALTKAYEASIQGFENAKGMLAKHGRAATRGEKSIGVADPGAAVAMLWFKALSEVK